MSHVFNPKIITLKRPIVMTYDDDEAEIRLIGRKTGYTLGAINILLSEEIKGFRYLSPERKAALKADKASLTGEQDSPSVRPVASTYNSDKELMNDKELDAINCLLGWAAENRDLPVHKIKQELTSHLGTSCIETMRSSQYTEAIKFLVSLPVGGAAQ